MLCFQFLILRVCLSVCMWKCATSPGGTTWTRRLHGQNQTITQCRWHLACGKDLLNGRSWWLVFISESMLAPGAAYTNLTHQLLWSVRHIKVSFCQLNIVSIPLTKQLKQGKKWSIVRRACHLNLRQDFTSAQNNYHNLRMLFSLFCSSSFGNIYILLGRHKGSLHVLIHDNPIKYYRWIGRWQRKNPADWRALLPHTRRPGDSKSHKTIRALCRCRAKPEKQIQSDNAFRFLTFFCVKELLPVCCHIDSMDSASKQRHKVPFFFHC